MAGMTPTDIDVAEVHDFFTGIELISYEDLGFADRFEAYKLVEAEVTSVGGALPVNPSGGLKSKGHPPGATGVAQCVELFAAAARRGLQPGGWSPSGVGAQRRRTDSSSSSHDLGRTRVMAGKGPDRWTPGIAIARNASGPMQAVGGLFAMSGGCGEVSAFNDRSSGGSSWSRPGSWREVALGPTLLVAIPFTVLVSLHAEHPAARARGGGSVRRGCGVRRGHPGGPDGRPC